MDPSHGPPFEQHCYIGCWTLFSSTLAQWEQQTLSAGRIFEFANNKVFTPGTKSIWTAALEKGTHGEKGSSSYKCHWGATKGHIKTSQDLRLHIHNKHLILHFHKPSHWGEKHLNYRNTINFPPKTRRSSWKPVAGCYLLNFVACYLSCSLRIIRRMTKWRKNFFNYFQKLVKPPVRTYESQDGGPLRICWSCRLKKHNQNRRIKPTSIPATWTVIIETY